MEKLAVIPAERIEQRIFLLRGQKVMLSQHLAELYGVPAKVLNQAVQRNRERFPEDFMFQLNIEIMRAFVRLRQLLSSHADLARKLDVLENKYDTQFKVVFTAIRRLMTPPRKTRRKFGFHAAPK